MEACPFCAGQDVQWRLGLGAVECQVCGAHGPNRINETLAAEAWNRRLEDEMDFFDQLQTFSERYFQTLNITETESPWGYSAWDNEAPRGAILHFTADNDFDRVVKYFMRARYNARASANVVIADRKYPSTEDLLEGLPLLQDLPVTIIQCRPPDTPSGHATWTNRFCYGIELLNVGEVRPDQEGGWHSHWRRDHDPDEAPWTMPWSNPLKTPEFAWGRHWEPYTGPQVEACVELLGWLRKLYPGMEPGWLLGHEAVQGAETRGARGRDKRDPGPTLPVHTIRSRVFGVSSPGNMKQIAQTWVLGELERGWAERKKGWVRANPSKPFLEPEPMNPSPDVAWDRFESAVRASEDGRWGTVGKAALQVLGYHIPALTLDSSDEERKAVWIFQKLMGLKPDSIPGPKTRACLVARLEDRGILLLRSKP